MASCLLAVSPCMVATMQNEVLARLVEINQRIAEEQRGRNDCKAKREKLDFNGHQEHVILEIKGERFYLSELDKGYASRLIRGHEMIVLGLQKVLNAKIRNHTYRIQQLEAEQRKLMQEQIDAGKATD